MGVPENGSTKRDGQKQLVEADETVTAKDSRSGRDRDSKKQWKRTRP